ncbi:MAG: phage portal protein [Cognatishimia activa]
MKLLDGVKSLFSRRSVSVTDATAWKVASLVSDSGESVSETSAMALSTVWACVRLIAGTTGSLPLEVRIKQTDGHYQRSTDHPLARVLHDRPNADQTALDFWEFAAASIELQGDCIARRVKSGSRLVSLVPAIADNVDRRRKPDGRIWYSWSEGSDHFELPEDEILHIRGFGGNALRGLSTLRFAHNAVGLARSIDRSAGSFFKNGMQPGGAIRFEDFLTAEQRDIANKEMVDKFIGARNAGRPMVLEGGASWEELSIKPEDAQMLEARRFSVEEICRFFGVPPHMVGHTEKSSSWGKGLEQQTLGFVMYTLRSRLKRIEKSVEQQLLTPQDKSKGVAIKFNLEGLLRGDSAGRASFYREMTQIGALTINEVRGLEGLPPVSGGDVPRMQMQNVPITEAGNDVS